MTDPLGELLIISTTQRRSNRHADHKANIAIRRETTGAVITITTNALGSERKRGCDYDDLPAETVCGQVVKEDLLPPCGGRDGGSECGSIRMRY